MKCLKFMRYLLPVFLLCLMSIAAQAQIAGTTYSIFPNTKYPVQSFTATGSACLTLNGLSAGSIRVAGTFTNFTVTFGLSNDANSTCSTGNFTNTTLLPVAGGSSTTSITAGGLFITNLAGMTQMKITATCSSCTGTITIQVVGSAAQGTEIPLRPTSADPCQDPSIQKQSVAISGTAPNATKAIPLVAGKTTYVCDLSVITGTAATSVQLKAGTQTTNPCDTGAVNLTGAMGITVGQQFFTGWGGAVFGAPQVPAANDICVFVAGGTAAYAGYATFVQQ